MTVMVLELKAPEDDPTFSAHLFAASFLPFAIAWMAPEAFGSRA